MGLFGRLFKKKERPIFKKEDELFANTARVSMEEMEAVQLFLKDKMDADDYNSEYNQACRLIPQQRYDEAIPLFTAVRDNMKNGYDKGSCDNQIGACYFFLGNFEKALDYYTRAFHSGYDKSIIDYNFWEAGEELMKANAGKAKWAKYYLDLFPDGQFAGKAKKIKD